MRCERVYIHFFAIEVFMHKGVSKNNTAIACIYLKKLFSSRQPGITYQNRLLMFGDNLNELYDFETYHWSIWPRGPLLVSSSPTCMVTWQDSLIVIGAYGAGLADQVERFNTTTNVSYSTLCF